ncbi:PfkB domain protein [Coriobacterium glomerans PW2]|uniref:PfkB domain protein n=1 Tax=Coriobacterium glomerans (strain ATCC 49209 / DSM 20642 / JCM 10262 / PW2) TaxID=700015 RepID=F2N7K6_CORGP|nr:fructoselysine 6-kinase [Coriobacterium glomerans]AEB06822.1 PfkB domain protein [Coriobacterium glomerans PW2]
MSVHACAAGFCCADVYEKLGIIYPTGNGIDWGIHLQRMGVPTSIVSVVGEDVYGRRMREQLDREGLDTSHLRSDEGQTSVMLMDLKNGIDRVHLEAIDGVMATFALTDEDEAFVLTHDVIHTDLFGNCLSHLAEWSEYQKTVIMDFSTFSQDPEYECERYIPFVDYAFMSFEKDTPDLREWLHHVQSLGPKVATATLGELGSVAYDGDRFFTCGIVDAPAVVNTVGAGDSYIAGFTNGVIEGLDIRSCMQAGASLSARVVSAFEPY